jgi:hypothetical protein
MPKIGAASLPLLFIPVRSRQSSADNPPCVVSRSHPLIAVVMAIYAAFVATLGRGLREDPLGFLAPLLPDAEIGAKE